MSWKIRCACDAIFFFHYLVKLCLVCNRWDRKFSISTIVAIAAIKISQMAFISADMQIISIAEFWFLQRSLVSRSQRLQRSWRSQRSHGYQALDGTSAVVSVHPWANSKWPIGQSERALYRSHVVTPNRRNVDPWKAYSIKDGID